MPIIHDAIRGDVTKFMADLREPVRLDFYPQSQSPASQPMLDLLRELGEISPAIQIVEHDQPATAIAPETPDEIEGPVTTLSVGGAFTGIRYLGFPGGQEFSTFLEDLVDVSAAKPPAITAETQAWLRDLTQPLHLAVFVTPT